MFGCYPKVGLTTSALPNEILDMLSNEEQLEDYLQVTPPPDLQVDDRADLSIGTGVTRDDEVVDVYLQTNNQTHVAESSTASDDSAQVVDHPPPNVQTHVAEPSTSSDGSAQAVDHPRLNVQTHVAESR